MPSVFQSNMPAVMGAISEGALKALYAAANIGRNAVLVNLQGPRSGRVYKIPGTDATYTASAPGEYPAKVPTGPQAGVLQESVHIVQQGDGYLVGTNVPYGLYLEKKDPLHGGREWLRPSLEGVRKEMEAAVGTRWF
jgi:hypothetical protein